MRAEEDRRGPDVGPRDAAGCHSPKALRPARKREVVKGMCRDWAISIRRACGALNFDRSTYHYTSRRADQAGLERRIREICETRCATAIGACMCCWSAMG